MSISQSSVFSDHADGWTRDAVVRSNDSADRCGLSITAAAAGFLFSSRAVLVLVSARWLHLGTEAGVIAGFLAEAALLLLAAIQAWGPVTRPISWVFRLPSTRWVAFLLAFSCISLLWSGTVSWAASFAYWAVMAADVALVLLFLRTRTAVEVAHSMMKGYIAASLILSAVAWIIPAEEDLRLGDLEYFNTNQIGNICAMGVFMAQLLASRKDGRWLLSVVFLTMTLMRSLSKATLIAFLITQAVLLLLNKTMTRVKKAAFGAAALLLILAFGSLIGSYYDVYTSAGSQAQTLTGRTGIWIYCLDAGLARPWIGNGIDAMWKSAPPFGPELFEARHAENELLQQFFAYGVVGIVMLAGIYGSLYISIRSSPPTAARAVLACLLLFILIRGLAEAEPFDLLLPLWAITLIGSYVGPRAIIASHRAGGTLQHCVTPPFQEAQS